MDGSGSPVDRHSISLQWLVGTTLAAICGAALMGSAVFASLDGGTVSVSRPEEVALALRGPFDTGVDQAQRGDRLPIARHRKVSRSLVRISTVNRVDKGEVVRARSFVRVGAQLSLAGLSLVAHIPPYNPQLLLAASAVDASASTKAAARPSSAVSFVRRELSRFMPKHDFKLVAPLAEVMARVREAATWSAKSAGHSVAEPDITGITLAYADEDKRDPFAGLEARIVPENLSRIPKTTNKTTGGSPFEKRVVLAKKGDTAATILQRTGAMAGQIQAILRSLGSFGGKQGIKAGDKLQILFEPMAATKNPQVVRVIVADATGPKAAVALADSGNYVAVDPKSVDDEIAAPANEKVEKAVKSRISLYQSLYETALGDNLPRSIIQNFIRIYAFDVDFNRSVQSGDAFQILYAGNLNRPSADTRNGVLFASLTVDGKTRRLYRFRSGAHGHIGYYDRFGRSAKKFLLRKPVPNGKITSGFGWRRHPLLGYVAMHTGVDWGAPVGTPIYAAGDGIIERERREPGYGRFVLIRHSNGYETAYAHMSAYARGTHVGERVHQGQLIGFVGATGLATGPHLHFEIRLNGHFVDPMRVKLPDGHKLRGSVLTAFEQERKRIDKIMTRPSVRMAALGKSTR